MKLTLTFLFSCLMVVAAWAQINDESPFPVDFELLSPGTITGTYDYGTQVANADNPIWGPTLSETVVGEIVWAYDATDSLGCEAIVTDLTGKIALIRRGVCGFVNKIANAQAAGAIACIIVNHYADPAQTGATVVGMLGGDGTLSGTVTIPGIFVGRSTGELITSELDAGNTVTGSFTVKSFYDPVSSYSYHTPLSEALPVNIFRINYVNPNSVDMVDVNVSAVITAPSGAQATLTGTSSIAPLSDSIVNMVGSYQATELGEHTITWTNDQNSETIESKFVMTEYTYAVDNNNLNQTVGPSDADFSSTFNFTYQAGSLVLADADGGVATTVSFGIGNAAALFTGDNIADQVTVILYDADSNADGTIDFAANGASFNDLTPIALGSYVITGNETADELVYVQLEDLVDGDEFVELVPDGAYYIVIAYDGTEAGTGVAPRFVASEDLPYLNFPTTPIFLDQLYTGWAGQTVAVRLHTLGFEAPVGTEDLPALEAAKVTIAPNPVQSRLNITFDLAATAQRVDVGLMDITGKVIQTYQYEQVLNQTVEIDVNALPAGTYFIGIASPEGFRAEKIIKQ
ncbi:MAG: hypothetical protein DA408_06605 [Bacteroidetes bacterium]|nr:MAG: hypothetical protein C7N36_12810 [Bacteroidota bacterium]PTM13511.1 MAG: hypothetical protein DA408_06605 [Bacteroidota bacterium]